MNWSRGFKRVWYFILGLIWIGTIANSASSGPAVMGEYIVYLLFFSVGWQLFGAALLWVARGFSKDTSKQSSNS